MNVFMRLVRVVLDKVDFCFDSYFISVLSIKSFFFL